MNFIRRETFDMWDGLNNLFLYLSLNKNSEIQDIHKGKNREILYETLICKKRLSGKHSKIALDQYKKKLKIIIKSWGRG